MGNFIIRDSIHGDIEFDNKLREIIETREFQRLHYIRQLAMEYLIFPTATNTRFSHSIGTYHVMKKLIEHFSKELGKIGYKVSDEDKELAYISALLHDIGHSSFSHSFEKIFNIGSHEDFTKLIIGSNETQINRKLVEIYGKEFVDKLILIMDNSFNNKESELKEKKYIFKIIRTLVSSQIDSDRMDYLLRDSYFTKVTSGKYDIERLIKSFSIEKINNEIKICISKKYLSTIEEYVLARYFMYTEVYNHKVKLQMEEILKKIIMRAKELLNKREDIFCDHIFKDLILKGKITLKDYLFLDDTYLIYHIKKWSLEKDFILSYLANLFVQRKVFEIDYKNIKEEELLIKINKYLKANNKEQIDNLENQYFFIKTSKSHNLYINTRENIWIKEDDGKLYDLSEKSLFIDSKNSSKIFKEEILYISKDLFKEKYKIDFLI